MKGTFLLRKWSSVSAAAAVLLGTSRASSTHGQLPGVEPKASGDGNTYEPLVLTPPSVKTIPEARFAGHSSHRSHSSHSSHRSHSSHYSGSETRTYPSYSPPSYSPPSSYVAPRPTVAPIPPAPVQTTPNTNPASRIELTNGTVVYGTLLTKSAAGITFTSTDGNTYKVERRWLTAPTVAALGLPAEQATTSPTQSPSVSVETPSDATLRQKLSDLEKTAAALRSENAALRKQQRIQTKPLTGPAASTPPSQSPHVTIPSTTPATPQAFWLGSTGKRHTPKCRYYGIGRGQRCGPKDGVACDLCGG